MRYKVIYDREACIGAFTCVAMAPVFWAYSADNKADLKTAAFNPATKKWELVIDAQDLDDNQAAAESCPVDAIRIEPIVGVPDEDAYGEWKEERKRVLPKENVDPRPL
jgi:ferredoxin